MKKTAAGDETFLEFKSIDLDHPWFGPARAESDEGIDPEDRCDDTFALISLVSAGPGIGFAPQWTKDFPNRNFELRKVRGGSISGSCSKRTFTPPATAICLMS